MNCFPTTGMLPGVHQYEEEHFDPVILHSQLETVSPRSRSGKEYHLGLIGITH